MRAKRFHGLKLPKVRMTWNKYNLYNISRLDRTRLSSLTHYQQKWKSKAATRSYHGEQIRERQWQGMFRSNIRSVVPMDPVYLARFDGSEQASGRGSGRDVENNSRYGSAQKVPYPSMTYAPIERRLDTAIFRALFASSARQARQFVIHGHVKVNGKKMVYPGYLLNPGDMFQVDVERVLTATGAPKDASERRETRQLRKKLAAAREAENVEESAETTAEEATEAAAAAEPASEEEMRKAHKVDLKALLKQAQDVLANTRVVPSAKKKQQLRALTKQVRNAMGMTNRSDVDSFEEELTALRAQLEAATPTVAVPTATGASGRAPEAAKEDAAILTELAGELDKPLTSKQWDTVRRALQEARENPIDASKPYATPWRPRDYMSAFAFVPRYLEVNQLICAAVYLRHPVARPGASEVPSPFHFETSQLAYTWYLRRR